MNRRTQRALSSSLTLLAVGLTAAAMQAVSDRLGDPATLSGWTLLASTAGLYLLAARKQNRWLRSGPVAAWLQWHTYMGTFASLVFLMHIGWPIRGMFEIALASCFAIVAISGIGLAIVSRRAPRQLAAVRPAQRLEHIPALRGSLAGEAHQEALASAALGEGATLAEFYQQRLLPFFQTPRHPLYRLFPSGRQRRLLLRELDDLQRYLAEQGNEARLRLSALVAAKDDLDFQDALQHRIRWIYALHVALTWALAMMIGVHVVLVYRFQGAV